MNRRRIALALLIALACPILALLVMSVMSQPPKNLGVRNGSLAPCPGTPNCVSSTAERESQRVAPLHYEGNRAAAMQRLAEVIGSFPRTRIVEQTDNYLRAEFTSLIFRFVDDVEFLAGDDGRIDVRSASRVGHSDLGVNRRRVEAIRARYER